MLQYSSLSTVAESYIRREHVRRKACNAKPSLKNRDSSIETPKSLVRQHEQQLLHYNLLLESENRDSISSMIDRVRDILHEYKDPEISSYTAKIRSLGDLKESDNALTLSASDVVKWTGWTRSIEKILYDFKPMESFEHDPLSVILEKLQVLSYAPECFAEVAYDAVQLLQRWERDGYFHDPTAQLSPGMDEEDEEERYNILQYNQALQLAQKNRKESLDDIEIPSDTIPPVYRQIPAIKLRAMCMIKTNVLRWARSRSSLMEKLEEIQLFGNTTQNFMRQIEGYRNEVVESMTSDKGKLQKPADTNYISMSHLMQFSKNIAIYPVDQAIRELDTRSQRLRHYQTYCACKIQAAWGRARTAIKANSTKRLQSVKAKRSALIKSRLQNVRRVQKSLHTRLNGSEGAKDGKKMNPLLRGKRVDAARNAGKETKPVIKEEPAHGGRRRSLHYKIVKHAVASLRVKHEEVDSSEMDVVSPVCEEILSPDFDNASCVSDMSSLIDAVSAFKESYADSEFSGYADEEDIESHTHRSRHTIEDMENCNTLPTAYQPQNDNMINKSQSNTVLQKPCNTIRSDLQSYIFRETGQPCEIGVHNEAGQVNESVPLEMPIITRMFDISGKEALIDSGTVSPDDPAHTANVPHRVAFIGGDTEYNRYGISRESEIEAYTVSHPLSSRTLGDVDGFMTDEVPLDMVLDDIAHLPTYTLQKFGPFQMQRLLLARRHTPYTYTQKDVSDETNTNRAIADPSILDHELKPFVLIQADGQTPHISPAKSKYIRIPQIVSTEQVAARDAVVPDIAPPIIDYPTHFIPAHTYRKKLIKDTWKNDRKINTPKLYLVTPARELPHIQRKQEWIEDHTESMDKYTIGSNMKGKLRREVPIESQCSAGESSDLLEVDVSRRVGRGSGRSSKTRYDSTKNVKQYHWLQSWTASEDQTDADNRTKQHPRPRKKDDAGVNGSKHMHTRAIPISLRLDVLSDSYDSGKRMPKSIKHKQGSRTTSTKSHEETFKEKSSRSENTADNADIKALQNLLSQYRGLETCPNSLLQSLRTDSR